MFQEVSVVENKEVAEVVKAEPLVAEKYEDSEAE